MKKVKQHHRIRAAGNGDEDFLPARKRAAVMDFAFEALEKFAHAVSLHFFHARIKRLARTLASPVVMARSWREPEPGELL